VEVKLWVDDLRTPPDATWTWATTAPEAVNLLRSGDVTAMSLDHDLGDDGDTKMIVYWLAHELHIGGADYWPDEVRCHSQNPVGRTWVEGMIERYKP
jgi:hypothetical protein